MKLAEMKGRPLVVLIRTTFCRASTVKGSLMEHDIIVNSAPIVADFRKYPLIVLWGEEEEGRREDRERGGSSGG